MTVTELTRNERLITEIHRRIHEFMSKGMSEKDAISRVNAELTSFGEIVGGAHFALSEAILQYRLKTNDWDGSVSAEELRSQYLTE